MKKILLPLMLLCTIQIFSIDTLKNPIFNPLFYTKACSNYLMRGLYASNNSDYDFKVDVYQIQGSRSSQQDMHTVETINGVPIVMVADGHGTPIFAGDNMVNSKRPINKMVKYSIVNKQQCYDRGATASSFVVQTLPALIVNELTENRIKRFFMSFLYKKDPQSIIERGYNRCNQELKKCLDAINTIVPEENNVTISEESLKPENLRSNSAKRVKKYPGTTAVLAFIYNNRLWCANTGDSRLVVLGKNDEFLGATQDHKLSILEEKTRVEEAGGFVVEKEEWDGIKTLRYCNDLEMSRALGDLHLPGITAQPDVTSYDLDMVGKVFLGCDGIFSSFDRMDAGAKFLNSSLIAFLKSKPIEGLAELVTQKACNQEDAHKQTLNRELDCTKTSEQRAPDNITFVAAEIIKRK